MYTADNILVESTSVNMSSIPGFDLDVDYIEINPTLDAFTNSIYRFKFEIGEEGVEQGFDSGDGCSRYSRIKIMFETSGGYEHDLGTAF